MRLGAIVLAAFWLAGCGGRADEAAPLVPVEESSKPALEFGNHSPAAQYVGVEACAECHTDQAATYVQSQMGRSFKPATRGASAADWNNTRAVYDPFEDFYYYPFARGDSLFLMEFRLADGDTTFKRVEKIDYIVGSGHHTNSHMMEVNGYVYQMPITWYVQEEHWDLPPGFDDGHNWRFERAIEVECMTCHNGMPDYVAGSDNRFADLPHGINCERCHGPGSLHIAAIQAGQVVDTSKTPDPRIVNPARLPQELQFDVCQRCHLQGVAVPKPGRSFIDFRPGMRLADVIDVYFPRYTDSLSQFIMASHPDRLRMSECRVPSLVDPAALDPLPCIACHDPHVPIEAVGRDTYNGACQGCHTPPAIECTEDVTVRAVKGDDCSSCHMPKVESIDIPHVRITDHNIRVPGRDEGPESGAPAGDKKFVRLASLTSPQPSHFQLGEGYLAYFEKFNDVRQFLDSAEVHIEAARAELGDAEMAGSLIRLWYLDESYDEIARMASRLDLTTYDDPWMLYRIGEAFANLGDHARSRQFYQLAVDRAPDHLWFRTKLASSMVALQDAVSAISILDGVLFDNPKFHHAYNNRGFAHLMAGNLLEAEGDFRSTLALDPDAKQALANLASFYFNVGEPESARPLIERLIELEPDNEQYRAFRDMLDS